jgi:hypothetical protein
MRLAASVAVVLCAALPARAAPTASTAPTAPIELEVPATLALGSTASVPLTLRAPAGTTLLATIGHLAPPRALSGGRSAIDYSPPTERHPQLALIAAIAEDGRVLEWRPLKLEGVARLEVQSEPRVQVRVRVGASEFGPAPTDDAGRAELPIRAGPGIDEGVVIADDGHGGTSKKRLALGVPPSPRVLASCARESTEVYLVAAEPDGAPLKHDEQLMIEAVRETGGAAGTLEKPVRIAPGLYHTRLSPSGELTDGEQVTVRARLRDGTVPPSTCRIEGELPSAATVALDRPAWAAGSGPVRVTVMPRFPGRRWHRAVRVELAPEVGTIALAHDGALVAEWRLPDTLSGRTQATLTARIGALEARTTLALHAAPAERLRVLTSSERLPADGRSAATLTIAATDRFGNPVPGARFVTRADGSAARSDGAVPPKAAAPGARSSGTLGPPAPRPDGAVLERYRAPRRLERRATVGHELPDEAEVVVRDERGGNQATLRLRLEPVPRRFEVTARLGYLTNFGKISAALVLADLLVRLPVWSEQLWVALQTGFASSDTSHASADGAEQVEVTVRAVPVLARFAVQPRLRWVALYAGATVGLTYTDTRVASPRAGAPELSDVTWAVGGFAGAGVRLGPGRLSAELGYLYAPIANAAASGNAAGLAVTLGYGVDFE